MAKTQRSFNDTQVFEHDEAADAKRVVFVDANGTVLASFAVSGNVGVLDSAGNRINPAKEDGNLATIAAKDFATQTTLALIKAKTDNLDVLLSTLLSSATFTGRINTQGQKTMAASTPVVLASD